MIARIKGWLAVGLGLLLALLGIFYAGRREGRQQAAQKAADDYNDTRKEIDGQDLGAGATDAERIERLRDYGGKW